MMLSASFTSIHQEHSMADKIKNYGITGTAANIQLGKGGPIISGANANVIVVTDSSSNAATVITAEGTENSHAVALSQLDTITADKLKYETFTVEYDGGTYNLANATANTRIVSVVVEAGAAWSNADSNTTITVGDASDADRLFTGFDTEVQNKDDPNHLYSSETTVKAVVTAGAATAGNATVTVWYTGALAEAPPVVPSGQATYLTAGTFSWTAPEGVTSVSAVVVGGGGGSSFNSTGSVIKSGAGGALAWRKNISVTPGQTYTVVVGSGGTFQSGSTADPVGAWGGTSYFITDATDGTGIKAMPGRGTDPGFPFTEGNVPGDLAAALGTRGVDWDGGIGGGGVQLSTGRRGGGGGAGGYAAGQSGGGGTTGAGTVGTDNGGGSGGASAANPGTSGNGGGVGLYGRGATGAAGQVDVDNGKGGFGSLINGAVDNDIAATKAGTGGGAGFPVAGGDGGVRIIWGPGRAYPDTLTGDV
jgi:hypothetical protein